MKLKNKLCKEKSYNSKIHSCFNNKVIKIILDKYSIFFNKHPIINLIIMSFIACSIVAMLKTISNPPVKVNLTLTQSNVKSYEDKIKDSESNTEQLEEADVIKPGFYKVGTDIPAGEYLITTENYEYDLAYISDYSDDSKSFESINFNDRFRGCNYVTINEGEYFELNDCSMIPVSKGHLSIEDNGYYNEGLYRDGMYKVGVDIPQGEYTVTSTERKNAYFEIDSDSRHQKKSIITSDSFKGEKKIALCDGQYIQLKKCKIRIKN